MLNHTHLHVERTVSLALLAGLILLAMPVHAQLGLGLSPMRLEIRYSGPASQSGALTLSNGSPERIRIRAEILDFFLDGNETPQFSRTFEQESEFSCRQWLTVNPMEFEVAGNSTAVIRYTLRVPAGAPERSYHCGAGFTTLPSLENSSGIGLKTAVRVVASFYAIVGAPAIEGGLKDVKLERVPGKPGDKNSEGSWRAVVLMENPSVMHYRPTGELEVIDSNGKVVEKRDLNSIPVLPKREQRFLLPLESLAEGKSYTLRARIDIGTHEIQEATVQVNPKAQPSPSHRANDAVPGAAVPVAGTGATQQKEQK